MFTISEVLQTVESPDVFPSLRPSYRHRSEGSFIGFALESMKRHTTNEGWQIFQGLQENGAILAGHNLQMNCTDIERICKTYNPHTILLQDKREWDNQEPDFKDDVARFKNVEYLKRRDDIFKLTILKDSQHRPEYHKQSADEIGCHAWVTYYNDRIVKTLAPYLRSEDIIRTYHTLDPFKIPPYSSNREGCLLSGAVSGAYPLRVLFTKLLPLLPRVTYLKHPNYQANKCYTDEYFQTLSKFKVSICTASRFGYLLRKIPESVACGCAVITDLPIDEIVPEIDDCLIRVHPRASTTDLISVVNDAIDTYDSEKAKYYAEKAKQRFSYLFETLRLMSKIENHRNSY